MSEAPRQRGSSIYSKSALDHEQLVARWAERGLAVPDGERAVRYVRHLGYFRLSPYTIPFQVAGTEHQFRPGADFDDVLDLYVFDRALRLLVLDALERIEVAVRSALTDHMSLAHDGPHWWLDAAHFENPERHRGLVRIVERACADQLRQEPESRGDGLVFRSALEHYLTTYGTPELPPSWLMVELLTVGQLQAVIDNLSLKSDKAAIAGSIGINGRLLDSWLRTFVRVRNICAHHGRLWNVGLGVYPAIPRSRNVLWPDESRTMDSTTRQRLYPVLVALQSVLATISPRSSWAARLRDLLDRHPRVPLTAMGIPDDWHSSSFWKARIDGYSG